MLGGWNKAKSFDQRLVALMKIFLPSMLPL